MTGHGRDTHSAQPRLRASQWLLIRGSVLPLTVKHKPIRGTWVAQSAEHLPLDFGSVMISQFVGSSSESGSVLTVRSLLGILSPSLSAPLLVMLCLSLSRMNT